MTIEEPKYLRRDRLEIILKILKISKNGAKKTHIMYKANLSYVQLEKYLQYLEINNFLVKDPTDTSFITTDKGNRYIDTLNKLRNLII